jgi:hypothetical protein
MQCPVGFGTSSATARPTPPRTQRARDSLHSGLQMGKATNLITTPLRAAECVQLHVSLAMDLDSLAQFNLASPLSQLGARRVAGQPSARSNEGRPIRTECEWCIRGTPWQILARF